MLEIMRFDKTKSWKQYMVDKDWIDNTKDVETRYFGLLENVQRVYGSMAQVLESGDRKTFSETAKKEKFSRVLYDCWECKVVNVEEFFQSIDIDRLSHWIRAI